MKPLCFRAYFWPCGRPPKNGPCPSTTGERRSTTSASCGRKECPPRRELHHEPAACFYMDAGEGSLPLHPIPKQSWSFTQKSGHTHFFVKRLKAIFATVAKPGFLCNSKGLLFVLLFAAGNARGAETAIKIANDLIEDLNQQQM